MKKLLIVAPIILIILLAGAGLFLFKELEKKKFYECLSYSLPDKVVAGTRVEVSLSCSDPKYKIDSATVSFSKGESFQGVDLRGENSQSAKLDTSAGDENLNFSFNVRKDGKEFRFPKEKYFQLPMEKSSSTQVELSSIVFEHEPVTFDQIQSKRMDLYLKIPDHVPVYKVNLFSRFSAQDKFEQLEVEYIDGYNMGIDGVKDAKYFEYYYSIGLVAKDENSEEPASIKTVKYPEDNFLIIDPRLLTLKQGIENYAKEKGLRIMFSFDDFNGGTVSIDGGEKVGPLSTIKDLVMLSVYEKLDAEEIAMWDNVSRYGYSGTVGDALNKMMISSSNEATGALIQKVGGIAFVNEVIKNYFGDDAVSYLAHTPGFTEAGGYNYVSADEQVRLMKLLWQGQVVSEESSNEMLELMLKCSDYFNVKSLPEVERIYMKTGYNPPLSYGLTGIIENGTNSAAFSLYIDKESGGTVLISSVKDLVKITSDYFKGL